MSKQMRTVGCSLFFKVLHDEIFRYLQISLDSIIKDSKFNHSATHLFTFLLAEPLMLHFISWCILQQCLYVHSGTILLVHT